MKKHIIITLLAAFFSSLPSFALKQVGNELQFGSYRYRVTKANASMNHYDGEVACIGFAAGASNARVDLPETIYYSTATEREVFKVTSIADEAFKEVAGLKRVYIKSWIKSIGASAFRGNSDLEYVIFDRENMADITIPFSAFTYLSDSVALFFTDAGLASLPDNSPLFSQFGVRFFGQNFEVGDITVRIEDLETPNLVTVTGLSKNATNSGKLSIAQTVNARGNIRFNVDKIGPHAFEGVSYSEIIIHGSREIGEYAFKGCAASSIVFNNSSSIGEGAFMDCANLKEIEWSKLVTEIPARCFRGCTSLETLTKIAYVKTIGEQAFYRAGLSKNICFFDVTSIGKEAFAYSGATDLYFASIDTDFVGESAFAGCSKLRRLRFDSLKIISGFDAEGTFSDIPLGARLIVNGYHVRHYYNLVGSIFSYIGIADRWYQGVYVRCTYLPDGRSYATLIDPGTWVEKDEEVNIPSTVRVAGVDYTVTTLGSYCLGNNDIIKKVVVPSTVKSWEDYAFSGCANLSELHLEGGDPHGTTYGEDIFYRVALSKAYLYVNTIYRTWYSTHEPWSSFGGVVPTSTPGTSVNIDGIRYTTIDSSGNCEVTAVSSSVPENVVIPEHVDIADIGYFVVRRIGDHAFDNSTSGHLKHVRSITIPKTVTEIGDYAFCFMRDCESIFPLCDVERIGKGAFRNCFNTRFDLNGNLVLGRSIKSVGEDAFFGCHGISGVYINGNPGYIGAGAFSFTKNCSGVFFPNASEYSHNQYVSIDGAVADAGRKTLITAPGGLTAIPSLPPTLTEIAPNAFHSCRINEIEIPEGVTTIGEAAFSSSYVRKLTLPSTLTSIGTYAFGELDFLTDIYTYIPDPSDVELGEMVFNISNQESCMLHTLPHSQQKYSVADQWSEYENIVGDIERPTLSVGETFAAGDYYYKVTEVGDGEVWTEVSAHNHVEIVDFPAEFLYRGYTVHVRGIREYGFAREPNLMYVYIPEGVEYVSETAFYDCPCLNSIDIPATLRSMPANAVGKCDNLHSIFIHDMAAWCEGDFGNLLNGGDGGVYLVLDDELVVDLVVPDGVTKISPYVFAGYGFLESVSLPEGLTEIGEGAFRDCKQLDRIYSLPESLHTVGDYAFENCTDICQELYLPKNCTNLGRRCFAGVHIDLYISNTDPDVFRSDYAEGEFPFERDGMENTRWLCVPPVTFEKYAAHPVFGARFFDFIDGFYFAGDANGDCVVDTTDVLEIINYMFYDTELFYPDGADANQDYEIDTLDILEIINLMFE